jgi:hypothetical protein
MRVFHITAKLTDDEQRENFTDLHLGSGDDVVLFLRDWIDKLHIAGKPERFTIEAFELTEEELAPLTRADVDDSR